MCTGVDTSFQISLSKAFTDGQGREHGKGPYGGGLRMETDSLLINEILQGTFRITASVRCAHQTALSKIVRTLILVHASQ